MFTVYLLHSNKARHYIGYTSNLSQRLAQHNRKHHGFTCGVDEVWEVIASKDFDDKIEAMRFEKYLKSFRNWRQAQNILNQ